jgi:aryl-alcohol dehydrogenase-like predicted oxidoreductase
MVPLQTILETLAGFVKAGKIRHIGISNETAWGMMKFTALSEAMDLPRMVSIQNCYNLLSRRFDYQQAEIAMREDIGLLPYSPLAMGYLTGKYDEEIPERSRKAEFPQFLGRYEGPGGLDAVAACNDAARELGITPTQFALKFVESRPFVTSNIIGATTLEQLKENIDAHDMEWTSDMEAAASRIHATYRSPVAS